MARVSVTQLDSDGLQADVMRFMAIIAFVLIAILALVDQMDTGPGIAAATNPDELAPLVPVETKSDVSTRPEVMPVSPPAASTKTPVPEQAARKADQQLSSEPQQTAVSQPENHEPRPLSLRFDSDEVFSALIASDRIQVFAHTPLGYVSLSPSFKTVEVAPNGEVYELLPSSVPYQVRAALGADDNARFMVALSVDTKSAIDALQRQPGVAADGGTLVILRNGLVRHES
jgi:hypothetical protein